MRVFVVNITCLPLLRHCHGRCLQSKTTVQVGWADLIRIGWTCQGHYCGRVGPALLMVAAMANGERRMGTSCVRVPARSRAGSGVKSFFSLLLLVALDQACAKANSPLTP